MGDPEKSPRVDEVLDVLSRRPRRELIRYFETQRDEPTVTLGEAVSHITGRIDSTPDDQLEAAFTHIHLPKLEDAGWIDYDTRTRVIRYRGHDCAGELLDELRAMF